MKVALTVAVDDTRIEERPDPVCGPGDVVCRVLACATCGSDVGWYVRAQAPGGARARAGRRGRRGGRRGRRRGGRRPRRDPPPRAVRRVPALPARPRDAVRAVPRDGARPGRVRRVRAHPAGARRRAAAARRARPRRGHPDRAARLRAAGAGPRRDPPRRQPARRRRGLQRPAARSPPRTLAASTPCGCASPTASGSRAPRLGRDRARQRAGRRRDRVHRASAGDRRRGRRRSRPAARCACTRRRSRARRCRSRAGPCSRASCVSPRAGRPARPTCARRWRCCAAGAIRVAELIDRAFPLAETGAALAAQRERRGAQGGRLSREGRAAVRDEDLRVLDVPDPVPGPGEVLVRIEAATTCGTDVKMLAARPPAAHDLSRAFGHEMAGVREDTGERVLVGDSVACGTCRHCQAGRPQICRDPRWVLGGFAELMAAPEAALHAIPDGLDAAGRRDGRAARGGRARDRPRAGPPDRARRRRARRRPDGPDARRAAGRRGPHGHARRPPSPSAAHRPRRRER